MQTIHNNYKISIVNVISRQDIPRLGVEQNSGKPQSQKPWLFGDTANKERRPIRVASAYEGILTTFTAVLQMRGYPTDTAGTGKEVIEKTRTNKYAAVLIDDELPDRNGIDLLKKLSKLETVKVMITDQPAEALSNGANGCFVKPVNPAEILAIFLELI
jgi:CheY-like chemotaxis protein